MAEPKPDTRTQRQKFIDAAREHGASESKDGFRKAVRSVAAPAKKPKKGAKPKG